MLLFIGTHVGLHTLPIASLNLDADDIAFLAIATGTGLATRRRKRQKATAAGVVDATRTVGQAFSKIGATQWSAVWSDAIKSYVLSKPGQADPVTAQQLADGVHGLTCNGCKRCQPPKLRAVS